MNLRLQAAADAQAILNDAAGFSWPIKVTAPDDATACLKGFGNDISLLIDPNTGMAVSGRKASIALALADIDAAGIGIPKGIAESDRRPWVVEFDDIRGVPHRFKVSESNPDRALGIVTCTLEAYRFT